MRSPIRSANPYGSNSRYRSRQHLRQKPDENPPAVERRNGDQIEHREHDIENERVLQIVGNEPTGHIRDVVDQVEGRGRQRSQQQVNGWSGGRHQNQIAARMAQRAEIHRHRLGVTEQER